MGGTIKSDFLGPRRVNSDASVVAPKPSLSSLIEGPYRLSDLTEAQRLELSTLCSETDPNLLGMGLLGFAGRLENSEKYASAAKIYSALGSLPDQELKSKALQRLNAILGQGSVGGRAEFLLGRFTKDATDPKMIVPMLAGTAVYSLARTAALGRLLSSARGAWYAEGMGARLVAGSLGFAAEVPTFALSSRALRRLSSDGKSPEPSLGNELASAAVTLGLLKGFSFAGSQAFAKFHAVNELGVATRGAAFTKLSQPIFSQAAMFSGLMTAHKVEENLGLRTKVDGATTVTDTLASMFSLGVGGHLGQSMLGPRFSGFQREMDLRAGLALHATGSTENFREIPGNPLKWGRSSLPSWLAKAGGASVFLSERLAFAQTAEGTSHASNVEANVATVLATAVVGGLLVWGAKAIRDHYVAPSGRIKDIQGFRAEIAATKSEKLLEQVRQSEQYLQQAKAYDRNNDEAIAVESLQFLAQALPHLPPEQRLARMEIFWDYLRDVGDHNSYLAIRAIKDSARHLPPEALASFIGKATIGLNFKDPDRLLNTIFVLMALMPHQDPERRKELSLSIGDALARREKEITEHLDYLRKSKLLLKDLKDFMDERLAKSKQELRQKIRESERKGEGEGLVPEFAKAALIENLKKQLDNLKDEDEADVLNAFREHLYEKDEVSPFWVHTLALDNAERLQEVFGEVESGQLIVPKHRPTLRERLEAVAPYLKDGLPWIRRLTPQEIMKQIQQLLKAD